MYGAFAVLLAIAIVAIIYLMTRPGPPAGTGGDDTPRPDNFDKP